MKLKDIKSPQDIKGLDIGQLEDLAGRIRENIIESTSVCGGHIAPSLGVVELTIALHYVLDAPRDKIIWDVGHQAYAHKLLTGRQKDFNKLRQRRGISGFPKRSESEYDAFGAGHSSTSISAALGFACARDLNGEDFNIAAVIGDGALTGGLAYEGLNNAGQLKKDMIVVLNDNKMFISKNVGAMGEYLTRVLTSKSLSKFESKVTQILKRHPGWGEEIIKLAKRSKAILTPGMIFEELGFSYFGPIDGHNIESLIENLERLKEIDGPKLLHVITRKGKGYKPAEEDPESFHGTGSFDPATGKSPGSTSEKYQDIFGDALCELASENKQICAITAAMESGTGLKRFAGEFPDRFFDVGIAEQHALTFAAAMACEEVVPVCAIYSTFIQRAYDQIIHDIALQGLPVVLALDRAGLVGEDGPTHHGAFDISFLTCVPGLTVMAPSTKKEMRDMLYSAVKYRCPVVLRYP
ncbi:MAG: 1-deoxy-D-xylulose-5-phosphate synthase, partial [Elusimicrobiota bacterium]|nr:1-deoxy-D-xylulose-5-phosphate synthase [Elusimicrobiota bacterium]